MFALKHFRRLSIYSTKYVQNSRNYCANLNFSHVSNRLKLNNTNTNLFKTLCTQKLEYQISNETIKISEAFLNLDNNYKKQLRIKKNDIEQLIRSIENEDIVNEDNYILLLQCCGHLIPDELPSSRIFLAQQAWKTFLNKKIKLTTDHYNALLQCYIENKMILSHTEFLSNMSCEPNVQTYDLLLECVCESGDLNQAVEIVNLMKENGVSANEPVFSSLILCHLKNGDQESVQNILSTMRIAQITPSSSTYTALLRGYAENNELDLFKSTLTNAQNREFNLKQLISILNSVCISENLELLPLIKKTWTFKFDSRIFETKLNNLCVNLIYSQKPEIAYQLFKSIIEPEVGFVSESDTYGSFLLYELIKSQTPSEIIIKIADDLIRTNRNIFALIKATEIALRVPDVKLSLILLQALFDRKNILRNHYFWPLLVHEGRNHGETGIFEIFEHMLNLNVAIESETLEVYSLQYIKNLDPEVLINKLKQFNLSVTDVLTPICVVLLRESKMKQVAEITTKYKVRLEASRIIKQLSSTYTLTNDVENTIKILKNIQLKNTSEDWAGQLVFFIFTRSGLNVNYDQVLSLLKAYKDNDIKISVPFVDKIEYLSKKIKDKTIKMKIQKVLHSLDAVNAVDNNNHIPHPRNMNLEELECHLIELRNKQMDTRGILRKLIQQHSRFGNADRVTELCAEFVKSGYNMSPGMKSSLLDVFLKTEQFDKAWKIYRDIKENHPTFSVDEFKVLDLARLFCGENKFVEANNLLKNEGSERRILGGSKIEHNCWKLLDTVAKTGKVKETRQMFKTLIENNYCTASNIILGPLVRVHICNNDKSNAAEEYVNCCTKYNKTPLLHELMCYLVKNESSSELIEKVIESTAAIHGAAQTQTTLAAALAETGLTKTLRKLFLDSNLNLAQNLLQQYCERWVKENKIQALRNMINGAQGITSIDLNVVYLNLMRVYRSNNDCDSALNLWNEMQDKNICPTEQIKNLVDTIAQTQNTLTQKSL